MRYRTAPTARHGSATLLALAALAASARAFADYPIVSHRYLADPGAMVSGGRIYLYNSNDDDNPEGGGYSMKSIVCVSSSDLKNWTDHGEVFRVPKNAGWAGNSWAPAAVERNGKVYLYYGNNGSGVGVASSASPTGTFTDAKGGYLVNGSTPGASGVNSWLFDPSVFIDDDGQAYLTFGGNGDTNARVIALNSDMVSVSGSAVAIPAKSFFEASWMYKRNGLYYFSYSTNPAAGLRIDYLTSTKPTSGFTYAGTVADQPPSNNNNNHHSTFDFKGKSYHAYHNRIVAMQAGISPTYRRNLGIDAITYNADGTIKKVAYTAGGLTQLESVDPYSQVEAETTSAQSGIETEPCSEGGMDVTSIDNGDWIKVSGVDFGGTGAAGFTARVASAGSGGNIELHLGSSNGKLVGTCAVPGTGGAQKWATSTCDVTGAIGVQDLYLKFTGGSSPLFNVNYWQFTGGSVSAGGGGAGGGGAGGGGAGGGGSAVGVTSGTAGSTSSTGSGSTSSAASGAGGDTGTGGAPAGLGGSGGVASGGLPPDETAGCGCLVAPHSSSSGAPVALALATLLVLRSRRRRAQPL